MAHKDDHIQQTEELVEVFDFKSNTMSTIPESQVSDAIKSKKFGLRKGTRIPVLSPDGVQGTVDSSEAENAFTQGFTYFTTAQKRDSELEAQFGDKPVQAAVTAATSLLSFGLSDQALIKSGAYTAEELNEIRQRNPLSTAAGTAVGIVGSLVSTGGAGAAVRGAGKAGLAAEKAVAAALKKTLAETGKAAALKRIVNKTIEKGAGSAVEGALFGTGQLISEEALGNAEFNAENFLSSTGMGALWGFGVGSIFGLGSKIVPVVSGKTKEVIGSINARIKGKFKDVISKEQAAAKLVGITPVKLANLKINKSQLVEDLPEWLVTKGDVGILKPTKTMFDNIQKVKGQALESIKSTIKKVDDFVAVSDDIRMPTRTQVAGEVIRDLNENFIAKFADDPNIAGQLGEIRKIVKNFNKFARKDGSITGAELHQLRRSADDAINYGKDVTKRTLADKARIQVRESLSRQFKDIVEDISVASSGAETKLFEELLEANKDYFMASSILPTLSKKIERDAARSFLEYRDLIAGGVTGALFNPTSAAGIIGLKKFAESDLKNRIALLTNIERSSINNINSMKNATKVFLGLKKAGKKSAVPVGAMTLANISLGSVNEKKKPKNESRQDSYERHAEELTAIISNPEKASDILAFKMQTMAEIAPATTQAVMLKAQDAMAFLHEKLPQNPSSTTTMQQFKRKYVPSTQQLAKYERYLRAVMDPMSVIKDLEAGIINREGIETLKFVYPEIFDNLQNEIMEKLPTLKEQLPYDKRLQLGILFDIPTDPSLESKNLLGLQKQFIREGELQTQQETRDQGNQIETTVGGLKQLELSGQKKTPLEKTLTRD